MLYDLCIPWTNDTQSLQRVLSFLSEVNYSVIALDHRITGAIPSKIVSPIPSPLPFTTPPNLEILTRCTITLSDPSHNHRLPSLAQAYDILAVRPTTEKAFLAACLTLTDASLISLDLTQRFPFHFRPKPLMTAVKRGVRIELCYSQALQGGSVDRRNVIMNIQSIVRATSGRGLVVSSEARSVLGVRAPADVGNLLAVWGLSGERAVEAQTINPRSVVVNETIKRTGFRGVVDVVDGGRKPESEKASSKEAANGQVNGKRKNEQAEEAVPTMSKRKVKKLKMEALKASKEATPGPATPSKDSVTS
ncbi:hypothetical protein VC83_06425 [Pseudogymnoascus destructans]|uniref:RNase P subunit p30 n=2 Tax=Pseudogymnoascus destructans TaxID=655981 RepID=L8FZG9_PSED2|nr:uncharacterized protein VC83_06425 [Pseudogymnoascus destructans]ELR05878.1 hypothetical protein GMDG_07651 [Pseudogymnoascus destructans 20631-21]OAF58338.1 hypothetical protein VC83_06425 [Pseudogymnoascus destructans]